MSLDHPHSLCVQYWSTLVAATAQSVRRRSTSANPNHRRLLRLIKKSMFLSAILYKLSSSLLTHCWPRCGPTSCYLSGCPLPMLYIALKYDTIIFPIFASVLPTWPHANAVYATALVSVCHKSSYVQQNSNGITRNGVLNAGEVD